MSITILYLIEIDTLVVLGHRQVATYTALTVLFTMQAGICLVSMMLID